MQALSPPNANWSKCHGPTYGDWTLQIQAESHYNKQKFQILDTFLKHAYTIGNTFLQQRLIYQYKGLHAQPSRINS
jgi:hypothetical protein